MGNGEEPLRVEGSPQEAGRPRHTNTLWPRVICIFLIGLLCRCSILTRHPQEGDEVIYRALVQQLEEGHGYTLRGHPVLQQPWIARSQYDYPLFVRPPGGIALFWLLHRLFGDLGLALAQLLSFSLFFWAMMLLASQVLVPFEEPGAALVAALSAFTPIMTQVTSRFWLDGPVLAFSTAAAALFLLGLNRKTIGWVVLAGIVLGYASLIKTTAVLVLPGLIALGWATARKESLKSIFWKSLLLVVLTASIELWWQVWLWVVLGTPFPGGYGKPAAELVATNPYVYYVTEVRSPFIYLRLLPSVLWTMVPAIGLLIAQWSDNALRRKGSALLFWVSVITGVHIGLGAIGYSKLLRYIVLVTPATVLIFGLMAGNAWQAVKAARPRRERTSVLGVLFAAAMAGFILEIVQGLQIPFFNNLDVIKPLW